MSPFITLFSNLSFLIIISSRLYALLGYTTDSHPYACWSGRILFTMSPFITLFSNLSFHIIISSHLYSLLGYTTHSDPHVWWSGRILFILLSFLILNLLFGASLDRFLCKWSELLIFGVFSSRGSDAQKGGKA